MTLLHNEICTNLGVYKIPCLCQQPLQVLLLYVVKLHICVRSRHSGNGQVSEARYVHGDLRLRNLAAKYVEGRITSVIMLDLDWAGVHGTQVYLADVNPSIAPFTQRPAGVQRGAVMLQIHDLETIQSEYKAKVCEHLVDMEDK